MKSVRSILLAAAASVAAIGVAPAVSAQGASELTIPIEDWALRDVVSSVQVSPDGKHVLVLMLPSKNDENILQIYKTEDMSKPFRTLNADPMEIIQVQWVSDNYIFGTAWQQNRSKVKGPEDDTRDYKGFSYNLESNEFKDLPGNFGLANLLPNEPDHILVESGTAIPDTSGVDPFAAFRPRSYYKFNLKNGRRELVLRGSEKYRSASFDNEGRPRWTRGVDPGTKELITYYRGEGDNSWKELSRFDQDDHENLYRSLSGFMGPVGFDPDNPNIGYVIDTRDEDKASLWEFNFATGQYGEKLAGTNQADIMGVQRHSMPGNDRIVAALFPWDKMTRIWFDAEEQALYEALEAQIPYAHQVSISSRSRDGKTMIVRNSGPRDPGSFWLVKDGRMTKLGSRNPLIKSEELADVEFIRYPSRDGKLTIPAYFMKPKGEGPFPLVVRHNGGPHVNGMVGWDEWSQMLVNAGYAVVHPQNRISTGWGQKHFDLGYGEHGLAMQDDKDDAALYLIEKGIVDPNRVAFFGWSYGGYAALVAAQRENQIYQCAIAGAAVADPAKSYRERRSPYGAKAIDDWAQRRGMIGINPIEDVDKVNIPLMMVHGDVDRRVEPYHMADFKKAMEEAGKIGPAVYVLDENGKPVSGEEAAKASATVSAAPQQTNYTPTHKFVTLEGADHFFNTLMYNHQEQLYVSLLSFLENDCGPGGL